MPSIAIIAPRISESARHLSEALDLEEGINSRYRRRDRGAPLPYRRVDKVINWGSSAPTIGCDIVYTHGILNPPNAVNRAANKRTAFRAWEDTEISTLEHTTNRQVAHQWLAGGADRVYCRTNLRGHSGEGIVVARDRPSVVQAPLYTKGVDTHHEFRIHVINGVVIDGVRKAFRSDVPEDQRNRDILNHAAGTIFVRSGPALERASQNRAMLLDCVEAVSSLGLDFGAVDVIVDREGNHYIIEVNTACGLEGTTLTRYTRAFKELLTGRTITPWNPTEFTLGQTEQEQQTMQISQATVGLNVTFSPSPANSIGTLTVGNQYTITRIGNAVIYVRNDRGRVQGYQPNHFQVSQEAAVFEGPEDGSIDTSEPHDSPLRVVRLEDGSSVNVTGQATFTGTSRRVTTGDQVTIADMWIGADTGDVFLGVLIGEDIFRFRSTSFESGITETQAVPSASSTPGLPSLRDSSGRAIRVGDNYQVVSGAGGHNLAVGSYGIVHSIDGERLLVTPNGTSNQVRIQPGRLQRITSQELSQLVAEEAALENQQVSTFTIGSHSYRVPQRDMDELRQVLRRFTV